MTEKYYRNDTPDMQSYGTSLNKNCYPLYIWMTVCALLSLFTTNSLASAHPFLKSDQQILPALCLTRIVTLGNKVAPTSDNVPSADTSVDGDSINWYHLNNMTFLMLLDSFAFHYHKVVYNPLRLKGMPLGLEGYMGKNITLKGFLDLVVRKIEFPCIKVELINDTLWVKPGQCKSRQFRKGAYQNKCKACLGLNAYLQPLLLYPPAAIEPTRRYIYWASEGHYIS